MKRQFTIPVTVTAYTKDEAQASVDLLLEMGAFLKDFNAKSLAGSFISHLLLAKLSQYTKGKMDLTGCYSPINTAVNTLTEAPRSKKCRQGSLPK